MTTVLAPEPWMKPATKRPPLGQKIQSPSVAGGFSWQPDGSFKPSGSCGCGGACSGACGGSCGGSCGAACGCGGSCGSTSPAMANSGAASLGGSAYGPSGGGGTGPLGAGGAIGGGGIGHKDPNQWCGCKCRFFLILRPPGDGRSGGGSGAVKPPIVDEQIKRGKAFLPASGGGGGSGGPGVGGIDIGGWNGAAPTCEDCMARARASVPKVIIGGTEASPMVEIVCDCDCHTKKKQKDICGPDVTRWFMRDMRDVLSHKKVWDEPLGFEEFAALKAAHKWMNFSMARSTAEDKCAKGKWALLNEL